MAALRKICLVGASDATDHDHLVRVLGQAFRYSQICSFSTESEFREQLPAIVGQVDLAVMAVAFKYADHFDREKMPQEVNEQGYLKAGFRCRGLMRELAPQVPVVLYTWRHVTEDFCREDIGQLGPKSLLMQMHEVPVSSRQIREFYERTQR